MTGRPDIASVEGLFRTVFDQAPVGMALVLPDGRIHHANVALAGMLGRTPEDLAGRHFGEVTHPDDLAEDLEQVERLLRDEIVTYALVKRYLRPDGQVVHGHLAVSLVRDARGEPAVLMAQVRDVSADVAAREHLRRTAALVEAADDAIVSKDLDGRVLSWNGAAERLYGWRAEEVIGEEVGRIVPEDRREEERAILAAVREGRAVEHLETVRRHRDGTRIEVVLSVAPIRDPGGRVVAAATVAHDIRPLREAERVRVQAEARFRTAFEQAPVGMAIVALDGRVVDANAAMALIAGVPRAQALGARFDELCPTEGPAAGPEDSEATREGRIVRPDGSEAWVQVRASLVRDDSRLPGHFLVQVVDVTERRRMEERLRHQADHDPLTGLHNRRAFEEELRRQTRLGARYGRTGGLLVLDLDGFKDVNDTLGHAAGDRVLTDVAAALRERVRETDVVGRLGGDEFAVLMPEADPEGALVLAEALLAAVREVMRERHPGLAVTASCGGALFDRRGGLDDTDVLLDADLALYEAKAAGRDRAVLRPRRRTRPEQAGARAEAYAEGSGQARPKTGLGR